MMSTSTFGRAIRIDSSGTSVCPPAMIAGVAAFGGERLVRFRERRGAQVIELRRLHDLRSASSGE